MNNRSAGDGITDGEATFDLDKGKLPSGNVAVAFTFSRWTRDDYLMVPGAVYAGNRFRTHDCSYPPFVHAEEGAGPRMPITITEVPRLEVGDGPSGFHLRSGDMTTPCVGAYSRILSRGFLLLFEPMTDRGLTGLKVTEATDRTSLRIQIEAPAVRERIYRMMCTRAESEDHGVSFQPGDTVILRYRLKEFPCHDIPTLFHEFFTARKELVGASDLAHCLPLSAAFRIIETKYNATQWNESGGYYRVGLGDGPYEDWQAGWVGGGMSTLPLLGAGCALSRARARRTMETVFGCLQTSAGFIQPIVTHGAAMGDDFCHHDRVGISLVRRQADVLLFGARHAMLLRSRGEAVPPAWLSGLRRLADALVRLWQRWGELGQFVDVGNGEIVIGGTASGAIAPAGLSLAASILCEPDYLGAGAAIAQALYDRHVLAGLLNGGPGDALQNPDSESAFGMLESLVVLYEQTGDRSWLPMAENAARQCAAWCMSYNFPFPAESAFGRLGMRSVGSVWANAQNKHSAPGIATLSPASLLKLFRATGEQGYLRLCREISHTITQYLSRDDRPIPAWDGRMLPAGWMCERVNTSDWEGSSRVGGVFYGSCWCEVSCLLTYTEIPGVWVLNDSGEVFCFDHVDAELADAGARWLLKISNPTGFDAEVILLVEERAGFDLPWGEGVRARSAVVKVPARGSAEVKVARPRA